jgi:hypothetical protein
MDIPYCAQGAILGIEDGALSVGWLNWTFQIPGDQFRGFSTNDDVHAILPIFACHVAAKDEKTCLVKFSRV